MKLNLFAAPPAVSDAKQDDLSEQSSADDTNTTAATQMCPVVWSEGVAYLQNPKGSKNYSPWSATRNAGH